MKKTAIMVVATLMLLGQVCKQKQHMDNQNANNMNSTDTTAQYTFLLSDNVTRQKVTFTNRYGIQLTGDLYLPKDHGSEPLAALAISGPFGAVKEQSSGL